MATEYGNNSIDSLEGAERVRRNPQNFLGSRGIDGAKHTIVEIIGNSTDEHLSGYGDELIFTEYEDGHYSLRDFGRGVPLGWNEKKGKWNYFLVYEELFAGGKYDKEGDNQKILRDIDTKNAWGSFHFKNYPYMITIGMNGVGGACTQYTSTDFEVISYRDGRASRMYYEKGYHVLDDLEEYKTDEPNGTFVKWRPDPEVFDDVAIPSSWVKGFCKDLSFTAGMRVTYINEKKGTTEVYEPSTIVDEVRDLCGSVATGKLVHHEVDQRDDICVCEVETAIGPGSGSPKYYNNMIAINGGSHALGMESALSEFFRGIGKEKGINIKVADYSGKLLIRVTTLANKMSMHGQTKDSLDDKYIAVAIYKCLYDVLMLEYKKGTKWLMDVIEEVEYACSLRVAQEELLKNHKEIEKTMKKHKLSKKFISCTNYRDGKYDDVELFIVEGDSAGDSVKNARNSVYQCLLKIRGKSLNVYKASIEKLLANREIQDMIASLGCGIDLGIDGYETFDISKLRVSNIFFFADADVDGKHINMLLFLIFYKLFPELLYQGKVWLVDSPLYVITTTSDESIYCMTEEEMRRKREGLGTRFMRVDRFKGWGEANSDDLWNTCLNPEVRVARPIKIERNDTELADVLEVLFGKSTERRKAAIFGNLIDDYDEVMTSMENIDEWVSSLNLGDSLDVEDIEVY